ncbi:hypothetical protein GCAAIG_06100 [Candidatus Electronema halotolerans]
MEWNHEYHDGSGRTPDELRAEFRKSLAVFLEVCKEKGINPRRSYSGNFDLRVPTALATEITLNNQEHGKEWKYRVIAVNKAGESGPSNTVTAVL